MEYPAPEPESSISSKGADHRSPLSVLEYPAPEPESSVSSKEADHPSPPSVLEVPFTEDVSSGSECFERVSAELNGKCDFLTMLSNYLQQITSHLLCNRSALLDDNSSVCTLIYFLIINEVLFRVVIIRF